jgi:hypothetical protein
MNSNILKCTLFYITLYTTISACSSNDKGGEVWHLKLCEESSCTGYMNNWYLTKGEADGIFSTWHQEDGESIELKGETTVLSTKWINLEYPLSLDFLMVDKKGDVTLEVWVDYLEKDYQADSLPLDPPPSAAYYLSMNSHVDLSDIATPTDRAIVPVNVGEWEMSRTFLLEPAIPTWVDSVAVHIVKKGSGTATIARLLLNPVPDVSSPPWGAGYDRLYYDCTDNNDCGDALFCEPYFGDNSESKQCSYCASDEDCAGVAICGRAFYTRDCVVPYAKPLGEDCEVDEECKNGICCNNHCSACCDEAPCADDQTCTQIYSDDPFQCNPGKGLYQSGELCYRNEDCESNICAGEEDNENAECPPYASTDTDPDAGAEADTNTDSNTEAEKSIDTENDEKCISMGIRYGQCE